MAKFIVPITRDVSFTQTVLVEVEAENVLDAETKALALPQDGQQWADDDESFHFGEDGTYCPDPNGISEIA